MCFPGLHPAFGPVARGADHRRAPGPTQPLSSRRRPVRPPEAAVGGGALAALLPDPRPLSSSCSTERCTHEPLRPRAPHGWPGRRPRAPAGSSVGASRPAPAAPETAPGARGRLQPQPGSELRPESPVTFPRQMWHVMGRVRDSVTFCTV